MTTTRRASARLSGETAAPGETSTAPTIAARRTSNGRAARKSTVASSSTLPAESAPTKGRKRTSGGPAAVEETVEPGGADRGKKRKVVTVEVIRGAKRRAEDGSEISIARRCSPSRRRGDVQSKVRTSSIDRLQQPLTPFVPTAPFEPIPIASSQSRPNPSDTSLPINPSGVTRPLPLSSAAHPPPPPSERRIARRRSSSRAIGDRDASLSPPLVPLDYGKKAAPAVKPKARAAGKTAGHNGVDREGPAEVINGLDGEGLSLEEELGQERGKWSGMVEERRHDVSPGDADPHGPALRPGFPQTQPRTTSSSSALPAMPDLSMLTFGNTTSADLPRAASPPPNPADYRLHTPARPGVSRRRSMAPAYALDAYVPDKEVSRRTAAALSGATAGASRDRDGLVEIAVADTPMIRKNRDMRRDNDRRRSSLNMRGNRLSESLTRGEMSECNDGRVRASTPGLTSPPQPQ